MTTPPRDPRLASQRFRAEREGDWRRLERILDKARTGKLASLSDEELLALPVLYRSALSSLSVARATSLDKATTQYLEALCTQAYFFVYGSRSTLGKQIGDFFVHGWPTAVRSLWRETIVSALLLFLGAAVAAALILQDPDWYHSFMPQMMAQGRDPAASTEALRETLYHQDGAEGLSFFATYLFTHNAQVAIGAFALGFAFCAPTALLLVSNGASLGAIFTLFAQRDLGFELGGWLLIHGVTELFAIILAGAGGLRIGWAVAFPKEKTRLAALAEAGRTAGVAMAGVVVMLMVAGLLEGFGRQLITNDWARYGVAAATAAIWGGYFYVSRPGAKHG